MYLWHMMSTTTIQTTNFTANYANLPRSEGTDIRQTSGGAVYVDRCVRGGRAYVCVCVCLCVLACVRAGWRAGGRAGAGLCLCLCVPVCACVYLCAGQMGSPSDPGITLCPPESRPGPGPGLSQPYLLPCSTTSTCSADLTIIDCNFEDNYASIAGGALGVASYGTTQLTGVMFRNNSALLDATGHGGALFGSG